MDEPPSAFERWLGEVRVDEAAEERRRASWLARQAADDSTCAQLAVELVDRGVVVVLHTTAGSAHRGVLEVAASDHLCLRTASGHVVLVRWAAVVALRPTEPVLGRPDAPPPPGGSFLDELEPLAVSQARVVVGCAAPAPSWRGELAGLGADHLRVRLDNGELACIPVASVASVTEIAPALGDQLA